MCLLHISICSKELLTRFGHLVSHDIDLCIYLGSLCIFQMDGIKTLGLLKYL